MTPEMLRKRAEEADAMMRQGRQLLTQAIREACRAGMSQRQIASLVGRSQPEVNRLLRFHGKSPNGLALRNAAGTIAEILKREGLRNPRVFGSTAREEDLADSDIDLLVSAENPPSLLNQSRIERQLTDAIGVKVDLVFETMLRPDLAPSILAEAVPL